MSSKTTTHIANGLAEASKCVPAHPADRLRALASEWSCDITSLTFARRMDEADPLQHMRSQFHYPKNGTLPDVDVSLVDPDAECVYLCGNSLGLMPRVTRTYVNEEMDKWANMGVYGHTRGSLPWAHGDQVVQESMARLVGGSTREVCLMNGLTVNIHLLMVSFYRPTPRRHKILLESKAFPSDHYAVESQIRYHGYDPATSMICVEPRQGEETIRTEDILSVIEAEGDSIALILWPGTQYYTGQVFDMPAITKAGQAKGCYVGFDLAHTVGNTEVNLHDWGVDFACWCNYKYLNSGAGAIGGVFIHERHADNSYPKLHGWWSHRDDTRFNMTNKFEAAPGVEAYRISNPSMFLCAAMRGALEVQGMTSPSEQRQKSLLLTAYLELLLQTHYPPPATQGAGESEHAQKPYCRIITPSDPAHRGCQLSVNFSVPITKVFKELTKRGVVLDKREPNVLRVAPTPLYNSYADVHRFVQYLGQAMDSAARVPLGGDTDDTTMMEAH